MTAKVRGNLVRVTKTPNHLVIIVNNCLTWTDNSKKECSKRVNALYQIKLNLREREHWPTKLNAYVGYVLPIVTYASEAWMPNRANIQKLENIQRKAKNCIL